MKLHFSSMALSPKHLLQVHIPPAPIIGLIMLFTCSRAAGDVALKKILFFLFLVIAGIGVIMITISN